MGNALHRLEVLLVGLVLLIAGVVVAVLLLVRPTSPSGYVQTTPQPIGPSVAAQPTSAPVSAAAVATPGAATAIPIPTPAPPATNAPSPRRPTQIPQAPLPRPPLPTLRLPTISVPKPNLSRLRLPRRHQRPLTIDCAPAAPIGELAVKTPALEVPEAAMPAPIRDLGVASL